MIVFFNKKHIWLETSVAILGVLIGGFASTVLSFKSTDFMPTVEPIMNISITQVQWIWILQACAIIGWLAGTVAFLVRNDQRVLFKKNHALLK